MNTMYIFAMGILLLCGCNAQKPIQDTSNKSSEVKDTPKRGSVQTKYNNLTLADYLKNLPGIQITNTDGSINVSVRGQISFSGDTSPIFVVSGSLIGTSYEEAARAVDVNDMRSVEFMNGTEAMQLYGMRATNGAIIIHLKK